MPQKNEGIAWHAVMRSWRRARHLAALLLARAVLPALRAVKGKVGRAVEASLGDLGLSCLPVKKCADSSKPSRQMLQTKAALRYAEAETVNLWTRKMCEAVRQVLFSQQQRLWKNVLVAGSGEHSTRS